MGFLRENFMRKPRNVFPVRGPRKNGATCTGV